MKAWEGGKSVPDEITLYPVEIEFVGLFDAVMGGVEWLQMFNPIRFPNQKLSQNVRHAVHILSIDENRYFFKPKAWSEKKTKKGGIFKQIWLPGVHSDVGGTGNTVWGRAALLTMAYYIEKHTDLCLDRKWIQKKERNLRDSLHGGMMYIDTHKFVVPHRRGPVGTNDSKELYHPIIDIISSVTYNGRIEWAWKKNIFEEKFAALETDKQLSSYFKRILK